MSKPWLWLLALAALIVAASVIAIVKPFENSKKPSSGPEPASPNASATPLSPSQGAPSLKISIASSNTKQDWLHEAVNIFNETSKATPNMQLDGRPIEVEIIQETIDGKKVDYRSGTMVQDTVAEKIKPTILSPGEESWVLKFKKEWRATHGQEIAREDAPVLVRTPLVVAMWQSRAKALGCWPVPDPNCTWEKIRQLASNSNGWTMFSHPEWGNFKLGYGYFGESNSGTLGTIAMCMIGANKLKNLTIDDVSPAGPCGEFIASVEKAKVHSGKSDIWLLEKMIYGGPEYLDAVITYESNVISTNRKHEQNLREPLVSVYPQDGTIVVGHPFAILDGAPWVTSEQIVAAKIFRGFLLSETQQSAVAALGLRPADPNVKIGSPIEPAHGANPTANLVRLEVPDTLIIDHLGEVWHAIKKHAVIAVVFDKSGSMAAEGKINAAIKGAQEFVRRMDGDDVLIWMPFDKETYTGVQGAKSQFGEQLIQDIGGTVANGGTALYDTVAVAFDNLIQLRAQYGNTVRYGIVVLSDGQDTNSKTTLALLEAKLKPNEIDPSGIQIHTIAIGSDADETVLKKISNAAHGRFWKGNSEKEMIAVYKEIATYY